MAWAVFGQTLSHDFVNFDDEHYVYDNPVIKRGLNWSNIVWAFTHTLGNNWHPLTTLSHMLDCRLYGTVPTGHHLTNVLLHTASAILLFLALKRMTGLGSDTFLERGRLRFWGSGFVAAVFAIHPLRVESVAWVSERKDVLSGLFFMLTLLAYLKYVEGRGRVGEGSDVKDEERGAERKGSQRVNSARRSAATVSIPSAAVVSPWMFYFLALLLYTIGLLSKPMLVTLPFVLLLLDYWPLNRVPDYRLKFSVLRPLVLEKIPFLLPTLVVCVSTVLAQQSAMESLRHLTMSLRIGNALMAYVVYMGQMVIPAGLAVCYPHPGDDLTVWKPLLSAMLLATITVGALAWRRKHPYLLAGWLWYLGMLVPVIGIVQVGSQAHADRYTYLPQIGLYLMVTWGAMELWGGRRMGRLMLGMGAGTALAGLLAAAYVQTGYWKDSVTLWTHTLACTSGNWLAENNIGLALVTQGKPAEAIEHYEQALQIRPDYAEADYNLGLALAGEGKLAEAIEHYERAIQIKADYAEAHNDYGNALAAQGKPTEACQHFERALQINPDYAEAHYNYGDALAAQGKSVEAAEQYERAIQIKPGFAEAYSNLGIVLSRQGKMTEAIADYERAIQIKTNYIQAYYNLGSTLAAQGKPAQAVPYFRQTLYLAKIQNETNIAERVQARLDSISPDTAPR